MRTWSRYFGGVIGIVSLWGLAAGASGESCSLELKKVDSSARSRENYIYRATSSQSFYKPLGDGVRIYEDQGAAKFADIIKKEPGSYRAEYPIRGTVKLGSLIFGFVLDTSVEPKKNEEAAQAKSEPSGQQKESKADQSGGLLSTLSEWLTGKKKEEPKKAAAFRPVPYDRLYFDSDHDGDLTDEQIIEADSTRNANANSYFSTSFPRMDVPIEIDSEKLDYAFVLEVTAYGTETHGYVNSSFRAAACREGEITLAGKKHRLLLIDFNGNGRFDDQPELNTSIRTSDNRVYASSGDRLYVDPVLEATYRNPYDITSGDDIYEVSKLIQVDGQFYELSVSPSGDKLTLEPSKIAVGYVTNPTKNFTAVLYGDLGIVKIRSDDAGKALLPVGSWKLKNYTLDRTGFQREKQADPAAVPSILDVLSDALGPTAEARAPRSTIVAANATSKYEAVDVEDGQTIELPFGPPYRPTVDVQYRQGADQVSLGMSLIGSAGETCSAMQINGTQPGKPKFTITTADGKAVVEGEFEYG